MSQGYTLRLRTLNNRADTKKLGVRLGRVCIKNDIPATKVAEVMGVTRQTVYNWFTGGSAPRKRVESLIEEYLQQFP